MSAHRKAQVGQLIESYDAGGTSPAGVVFSLLRVAVAVIGVGMALECPGRPVPVVFWLLWIVYAEVFINEGIKKIQ